MKIKEILIIFLFFAILPARALTLEGGVKTVGQIRQEVFLKPIWVIDPHPYRAYAQRAPEGVRIDYSDGGYTISSGTKSFTYNKNNKLGLICICNKNVLEYPHTSYQYSYPCGQLEKVVYATSEGNAIVYNPDKSLYGIWENKNFYKGDQIQITAKTSYF